MINNITGKVDYTADNTVNSIPAFNSAFANIKNIANIDTKYGGTIEVTNGRYLCKTKLDMSYATNIRHGLALKGHGKGCLFYFDPASALTDAVFLACSFGQIDDIRMVATSNVTNFIRIEGAIDTNINLWPGSRGGIHRVSFEHPNFDNQSFTPSSQVGILIDGVLTDRPPFYYAIDECHFMCLGTGIQTIGVMSTSFFLSNCGSMYTNTTVDIGGGQTILNGLWCQGHTFGGITGVRIRGTTGLAFISNVHAELPYATGTNTQAILIDSGATKNTIMNVENAYADPAVIADSGATSGRVCVIRDNSGNTTNSYRYRHLNFEYEHNISHKIPVLFDPYISLESGLMQALRVNTAGQVVMQLGNQHASGGHSIFDMFVGPTPASGYHARMLRLSGEGGELQFLQGGNGTGPIKFVYTNTGNSFEIPNIGGVTQNIKGVGKLSEDTGAGSAALGANSPAVTNTAPYKWLKTKTDDGSVVYIPCWK